MNRNRSLLYLPLLLLACLNAHAKVTVVGTGYVGLVTGAGLAEFGNEVICCDVDTRKIDVLLNGGIPIYEPGLDEVVARNIASGRLSFTADVPKAIREGEVIFIGVGTPMSENGAANLSYVKSVAETIAANMNEHKVICTKSTVPVGTGAWIRSIIEGKGIAPDRFSIVSNPEFLREGCAVDDFLNPDRVVIGIDTEKAEAAMRGVYKKLIENGTKFVFTNVATSETIKYASNAFLATKLSYINELSNLCDKSGANIKTVSYAMGLDKRISPMFLNPGPGFGGSCFPKDSQALIYTAQQFGVDLHVVQASLTANVAQKKKPAQKLLRLMNNDVRGKTIAILGLAFKGNTDDIRYSPAIYTIQDLLAAGAIIKAYDPAAMDNMKHELPTITYCSCAKETLEGADALIIMTEWDEFKKLDLEETAKLMKGKPFVDARNLISQTKARELGFIFENMGNAL